MKSYNLIVPIAGRGQRMLDGGYEIPKPMMVCGDKSILEWSMESIEHSQCHLVFVVREEHVKNFGIDGWLRQRWPDCQIETITQSSGAADTVNQGLRLFTNHELPLIVFCPDVTFEPVYQPSPKDFEDEGLILTFKANSPNYSYVIMSSLNKDEVRLTVEKIVPACSNLASVGVYCFKTTKLFHNNVLAYLSDERSKEHHICPLYNWIIRQNGVVRQRSIEKVNIMGTPKEFQFFENVSYKYFTSRKFAICSDHSGFALKQRILEKWKYWGIPQYIDFGCYNEKDCDYNLFVKLSAEHVLKNKDYFGIGICRSGQGINICANKIEGIRSCLIQDEYHAAYAIKHNAGNFFSLSAMDFEDDTKLEKVLDILYSETFDGGRHQNRMMKND